jgi:NhaA family Na+:H+ antiporter
MATDIAFALGILALFGSRVPAGLKLLLLSVAIVDDIGAVIVIAVFYSGGLSWGPLAVAVGLLGVIAGLHRMGVVWWPVHVLLGVGVWLATYTSGVQATIAGVALGLLMPTRPLVRHLSVSLGGDDIQPSAPMVRWIKLHVQETISAAERLEHTLHPWTSLAIVPLFALANAGVVVSGETLRDAATSPIAAGVVIGLVVGKPLGITAFAWLAVRLRLAGLPSGTTWGALASVSALAGIGFTVSILVAGLAFEDPGLVDEAKLAILAASLLAALAGSALVLLSGGRTRGRPPRRAGVVA